MPTPKQPAPDFIPDNSQNNAPDFIPDPGDAAPTPQQPEPHGFVHWLTTAPKFAQDQARKDEDLAESEYIRSRQPGQSWRKIPAYAMAGISGLDKALTSPLSLGTSVLPFIEGAANGARLAPALESIPGVGKYVPAIMRAGSTAMHGGMVGHGLGTVGKGFTDTTEDPMTRLSQVIGGGVEALGGGLGFISQDAQPLSAAGAAVREAAMGNPDAAAMHALRIPAASTNAVHTLEAVEGARPFLKGTKSIADAQTRIPAAQKEIWAPYKEAINSIGDRPVQGPDGMTTVRALEEERKQLSALNRGLKNGDPASLQLAQQKGLNQAQLLDRERAVQAALDPELEKAGLKPQEIRKAFGQVSQVGSRVLGRTTLTEKSPSGFGRMLDVNLNPRPWFGSLVQGGRDLIAGRPLWTAKPSDVAIREAFRVGGEKPDFGSLLPEFRAPSFSEPSPFRQPRLPAQVPFREGEQPIKEWEFGVPNRPRVTAAPSVFARLPETASEGEAQPMIWARQSSSHPGIAEDFARMRIAPTRGQLNRMGGVTLPSEHEGLALPAPFRKAFELPAEAGQGEVQPMIWAKRSQYPPLAEDFARERITPTRFKGPPDNPLGNPKGFLPAKASTNPIVRGKGNARPKPQAKE